MAEGSTSINELMLSEMEKMNTNLQALQNQQKNHNRRMFGNIAQTSMKKATATVGAAGMMAYTKSVIDTEASMKSLGKILDESPVKLLKMERAGQRFGTSFTNQLLSLRSIFAGLHQEDVSSLYENLAKYGVQDPQAIISQVELGDTLGIFEEIQKIWGDLSKNQQIRLAETLGFDVGMMSILNDPSRFQDYTSQTDVTEDDIERASQIKEEYDKIILNFNSILTELTNALLKGALPLSEVLASIDWGKLISVIDSVAKRMVKGSERSNEENQVDALKSLRKEVVNQKQNITDVSQIDEFQKLSQLQWDIDKKIKELGGSPISDVKPPDVSQVLFHYSPLKGLSDVGRFISNKTGEIVTSKIEERTGVDLSSNSEANAKSVSFSPQINIDASGMNVDELRAALDELLKEQYKIATGGKGS